jgi:uncharacterized protein YdcH (DUF465 family)
MPSRDEVKGELLKTDEEFRRLYDEHQEYERRLATFNQKSPLSQDDELEAKRLKIQKLHLKDRMEMLIRTRVAAEAPA